jgi:hypothetical protein
VAGGEACERRDVGTRFLKHPGCVGEPLFELLDDPGELG